MLVARMIRAARLDVSLYEEVEHDLSATQQALTVVLIVAIANALGGAIGGVVGQGGGALILGGILFGLITAIVGWVLMSYVMWYIGTNFFKGTATPGEMLRTIGFAQTPRILGIVIFIPCLGPLVALAGGIWTIVASVIAIRQGLNIDTANAIVTAIIGAIALAVLYAVIGLLLAVLGLGMAVAAGGV